jgi:hypothetical protein
MLVQKVRVEVARRHRAVAVRTLQLAATLQHLLRHPELLLLPLLQLGFNFRTIQLQHQRLHLLPCLPCLHLLIRRSLLQKQHLPDPLVSLVLNQVLLSIELPHFKL